MGQDQQDATDRAAADLTKSQGARPDTRPPGEQTQEVGQFEGEDQHGWAPDIDAEDDPEDPEDKADRAD